jgi:hypothetical protein
MPRGLFWLLIVGAPLLALVATGNLVLAILVMITVAAVNPPIRIIRKNLYFRSEKFQEIKAASAQLVEEHNAVVGYVDEIRDGGSFELGSSSTGQQAHLATFSNTSAWNYRRDRNLAEYAPHVHHASLQVVRNASADPIKYLMKYFAIRPDVETLADVQRVAGDISRLEEAIKNVGQREKGILNKVEPPDFILKHFESEFWSQVGVRLSPIEVPYPRYKFQYTSAGGNSGQVATVTLDTPTLDALSETLANKIRWTNSVVGQRALMTANLRNQIKSRDQYRCLSCSVSVAQEPHLLLEVDHIVPLSKGGLSVPENLQTLCWKCNRSKGAKLLPRPA